MLKYYKSRPVKSPMRAHPGDAGIDFFIPDDFKPCYLGPGQHILIPSGIHVDVPYGWALIFFNKSGVASKKQLDVLACVVDHGYQGECHFSLVNTGNDSVALNPGEKIVQGILLPIGLHELVESEPELMWQSVVGDRGDGGFGSTGC